MAIVIKEILASDNLSQLTDKINFNFDQFLINGGGPPGPIGPIGPIGPTGPRGSYWFDGSGAPTTVIGSEEGDYYLDISTGDVYLYDGSLWTLEGNIQGPQGPVGPQGPGNILFDIDGTNPDVNPANYFYRYRFINADSDLYTNSSIWSSQSLLIGGFPEGTNSNEGISIGWGEITDVYSNQINPSVGSLFVHMPVATSGKNIILSRILGDNISTFNTDVVSEMASISVDDYDSLFLESNRIINNSDLYAQNIGLKFAAYDSNLSLISGRNINISTQSPVTGYNSSIFGADTGNGIITITALESIASGYSGSALRLQKGSGSTYGHAYIALGTGNPTLQPSAGDGSILIKNTTGDDIDIDSSGILNLIANADINIAADAIYLDSTVLVKLTGPLISIADGDLESGGKVIFGADSLSGSYNTGQIFLVRETSNSVNTVAAQSGWDFVLKSINYTGTTSIPEGARFGRIVGQINTATGSASDNFAGISLEADSSAGFSGQFTSRIRFHVSRSTSAMFEQRMDLTKNGYLKFLWDPAKSTGTNRDAKIFMQDADSSSTTGASFTIKGSNSYTPVGGFSAYNGGKIVIEGGDGYSAGGSFGYKGNIHLNPWHSTGYVQNAYGVKIGGNTTSQITASLSLWPMVDGGTTYALNTHSLQVYDTAGVERFGLKNDGSLSVGLKFPATQVTSSDANTLDDYEEGNWTPALSPASGTVSTTASGRYTKIGRMVIVSGYIVVTGAVSNSGALTVTGLPFTCASGNAPEGAISIWFDNLTGSATTLQGYVVTGTTTILIQTNDGAGQAGDAADNMQNTTVLRISTTYIV